MGLEGPNLLELAELESLRVEYLSVLKSSQFALCPTGSGPSSIRMYEALALNVIPIVLTNSLALPGLPDQWSHSCIVEEDSIDGVEAGLRAAQAMSAREKEDMVTRGKALLEVVQPAGYGDLMVEHLRES